MASSQQQVNQLREQMDSLREENRQAQQTMAFMKEKLSSQKMMLDEVVAYSTRLEAQLSAYQS